MREEYSVDDILDELDRKARARKEASFSARAENEASDFYSAETGTDASGFYSAATESEAKKDGGLFGFYEWAENLISTFVCIVLLLTFFVRMNEVSGISMEPTLLDGDRLLVYQLGYAPQYNDVVIIQADNLPNSLTGEMGEGIVKRVIGLEGDVMNIDIETGTVYRNGEALTEDFIAEVIRPSKLGNADFPVTVGKDEIFVLGDNRNHSTDSRWVDDGYSSYYVGCIKLNWVIGKAFFRVFPLDRIGGI